MLQKMRSAAKWVWIFVMLAFVGGFLLVETSDLLSRSTITPTTAVAKVNGEPILYTAYEQRIQQEVQSEQQRSGRSLSEDEVLRIRNAVFDQMVADVLLRQEYDRRGIVVTDEEIQSFALTDPPSWIRESPEMQTEGRFDIDKYRRFIRSSYAKQAGVLVGLEQYFRAQIPQYKLFNQLQSGVFVTDAELWRIWQDQHDSAQVSFVAFRPTVDSTTTASDNDLRAYYDAHKDDFKSTGQAWVTVVRLRRELTAADSAAVRQRAAALRAEIASGTAKFEDVARRESVDTASGTQGGDLGRSPADRYVPEFSQAARSLRVGEISQPVLSPFGYHLIRLDDRKGDTLALHHILLSIHPTDSAQARLDRTADDLARIAASASADQGAKLDTAARKLQLTPMHLVVRENEPAQYQGSLIPSVSAWSFGGARPGETSPLFDDANGYYLARLDSVRHADDAGLDAVRAEVRQRLVTERAVGALVPMAEKFAAAAARSTLEAAARTEGGGREVQHSPVFARGTFVPGIGQFNEAIGASFGLPVGAVSAPVKTADAVFVLRVDRRVQADSAAWLGQRATQRQMRLQQLQQQRSQMYMQDLRESAKIEDYRRQINATIRRTAA